MVEVVTLFKADDGSLHSKKDDAVVHDLAQILAEFDKSQSKFCSSVVSKELAKDVVRLRHKIVDKLTELDDAGS